MQKNVKVGTHYRISLAEDREREAMQKNAETLQSEKEDIVSNKLRKGEIDDTIDNKLSRS